MILGGGGRAQGVKLGQPSKFERYRADPVRMMGEGFVARAFGARSTHWSRSRIASR